MSCDRILFVLHAYRFCFFATVRFLSCVVDMLQKVNEKHTIVIQYESGAAIPNSQILSKLQRILGMYVLSVCACTVLYANCINQFCQSEGLGSIPSPVNVLCP